MLLVDLIDKYATKDDISLMMKSSGLPSTGSKRQMLATVRKHFDKSNAGPLLSKLPQAVLVNMVRHEKTSAGLLLKIGLTSKSELIKLILRELVHDDASHARMTNALQNTINYPQPLLQRPSVITDSQLPNPFQDSSRQKLFDMLMSMNKEPIQVALSKSGDMISGNKYEIVVRLINSQNGDPRSVIPLIDLANLQYLASHYGIQRKRLKEEQVNEILAGQFNLPQIAQQPPIQQPPLVSIDSRSFLADDLSMKLFEVLNKTDKDCLKTALSRQNLPVSGKKEELISRIIDANKKSPMAILNLLDGWSLQSIATAYDIPRRRSKEDQASELLHMLFGYEKHEDIAGPDQEPKAASTTPMVNEIKETPRSESITAFETLISEIEMWVPSISFTSEDGYRAELNAFLRGRGHETRMEEGSTHVDILVDKSYPIEVKKSPRGGELDRALGQVCRHLDAYHNVIVVVCKPKFMDELEDFGNRIKKYIAGHNHPYRLIMKG